LFSASHSGGTAKPIVVHVSPVRKHKLRARRPQGRGVPLPAHEKAPFSPFSQVEFEQLRQWVEDDGSRPVCASFLSKKKVREIMADLYVPNLAAAHPVYANAAASSLQGAGVGASQRASSEGALGRTKGTPRGAARRGDWVCTHCGCDDNWAKKPLCHGCKQPTRPAGVGVPTPEGKGKGKKGKGKDKGKQQQRVPAQQQAQQAPKPLAGKELELQRAQNAYEAMKLIFTGDDPPELLPCLAQIERIKKEIVAERPLHILVADCQKQLDEHRASLESIDKNILNLETKLTEAKTRRAHVLESTEALLKRKGELDAQYISQVGRPDNSKVQAKAITMAMKEAHEAGRPFDANKALSDLLSVLADVPAIDDPYAQSPSMSSGGAAAPALEDEHMGDVEQRGAKSPKIGE